MEGVSEHPDDEAKGAAADDAAGDGTDRSGSRGARMAWGSTGITFFMIGVVFTLTMPDNIALGITFLGLGVVFFTLAGTQRAPGDGPGAGPGAGPSPDS